MGGNLPVYVKYDISEDELISILYQVNGVFFTGGGLDLCDENKDLH